jgi:ABC-type branched-subunit amino acid transport system ATPase component
MTPLLDIRDIHKHYGAIKAVDGVSFSVGQGEIVGVIGPNGSGKTTLFNSVLGQIRPSAGHVSFSGEDITGHSPLALSRRGVSRTISDLAGVWTAFGTGQSHRRRAGIQRFNAKALVRATGCRARRRG